MSYLSLQIWARLTSSIFEQSQMSFGSNQGPYVIFQTQRATSYCKGVIQRFSTCILQYHDPFGNFSKEWVENYTRQRSGSIINLLSTTFWAAVLRLAAFGVAQN